jgi:hypothetical protein
MEIRVSVIVFSDTLNNILAISWWLVLLAEDTRVPGENRRPVVSKLETLKHDVVSSTHRHEQDSNSQR